MRELTKHKFCELYEMSSGISTSKDQAGHGSLFVSFSSVFNHYFLPDSLPDLMFSSEKEQETYSVKQGDIFLTRTSETLNELGMSCVVTQDHPQTTFSGFLKRLRPIKSKASYHKFMAFYLRSQLFRKTMSNNAVMTLRCSLNENIFSYLDLLLPEYNEQVKIGDFLYLLHHKIELNNRINEELEGMAKLLYDYWFVQFDFPITAEQAVAMGKPELEGKPYQSSGAPMTHNPQLNRMTPEGWEVARLEKICSNITNAAKPESMPPDSPYVGLEHVARKCFSLPAWGSAKAAKSQKLHFEKTDFLFGKLRPYFHKVCQPPISGICSTDILVLRPTTEIYRGLLGSIIFEEGFVDYTTQLCGGTRMPRANWKAMALFEFALPNEDLLQAFNGLILPLRQYASQNTLQNQHLTALRDWLLPMLMNGQVTVK